VQSRAEQEHPERQDAAPPAPPAPAAPGLTPAGILALQRSAGNAAVAEALPAATAARMGGAFGRRFDDVRVHPASPAAAGRVQAVTRGRDVHFQAGAYRPGEPAGDWLIAHELAHVVQQGRSSGAGAGLEREADAAADAVAAGGPASVDGAAPFGAEQRYEAWEHRDLGDAHGGAGRTVTLECGITLTYGQVVALSGDFYRSPEALMRAPRAEIERILAVMRREADQAHASPTGAPTRDQVAANNADYEMATSGSQRAQHHSHTGDLLDEDEGHGHDHRSERGGHGLVVEGEHVEDAGPAAVHDVPSAEASFFGLADANASHFSPENIRNNFIPKHQLALDYAGVAHRERAEMAHPEGEHDHGHGGPDDPSRTPGAAPSARSGELPPTGASTAGAPGPLDATSAGPPTPVGEARFTGGGPGERQEAMAWVSNGFADHYLTDAFAGGHLVSGNVGRTVGGDYFRTNAADIRDAMLACLRADFPQLPDALLNEIVDGYEGLIRDNLPSLALKLVHDELNRAGVLVRNARGTEWRTVGDAALASSPETRNQAELASKASRDAVQETLDTGAAVAPFAALDYIPDVAQVAGGGFVSIAQFAEDPATFKPVFDDRLLSHSPTHNTFYAMMKGNTVPMVKLKARQWVREKWDQLGSAAEAVAEWVGERARGAGGWLSSQAGRLLDWGREQGGRLLDFGREQAGRALGWGREQGERLLESGEHAVEEAGEAIAPYVESAGEAIEPYVESAEEAIGEVVDDAAGVAERARRALETFESWGEDRVEEAAEAVEPYVEAAGEELSELGEELSEWAGPIVHEGEQALERASETASGIWGGIVSTGNAFLDRARELGARAVAGARGLAARGVAEALDLKDRLTSGGEGARATGSRRLNAIGRHTYAHGGYMGAAGAFMADPEWRDIFARLMPADFRQADRLSEVRELMQFLENNPVLNAYGTVRHMRESGGGAAGEADPARTAPLPLEWDVWLPPNVGPDLNLAQVKIAHGNKGTTVAQRVAGEDPIGLARRDVADRPNATAWMELFAQAIAMHRAGTQATGGVPESSVEREQAMEEARRRTVAQEALDLATQFLRAPGGLILDIKSSYSTAADVATFVGVLRARGINVIGVGTFAPEQLAAVPEGVRRVRFFNGVNGLEAAAARGELHAGDDVMFNAGALVMSSRAYVVAGELTWEVDREAYQRVVAVRQSNDVHVGLYVQESDVAAQAVEVIVDLVNSHPDVFDRGFAYGNVGRAAETQTEGSGMGDQAALDALDWVTAP
jgi:hypothetical protein